MAAFSSQELTDIVLMYGECHYSVAAIRRLCEQRFPNRRQPSNRTVLQSVQRLRDTGSVRPTYEGRGRDRPAHIQQAEEEILDLIAENPTASTYDLARDVGVSQTTANNILRAHLLHPYHVQRVQQLTDNDWEPRRALCAWFRRKEAQQPDFAASVLFTDECCFTRDGILNYHNTHYWCNANPHVIRQSRFQWRFSVNVWCGIFGDTLLGPIVLPQRLNGPAYLQFLETTLPDLLEDIPLLTRAHMWFMHDGAPPHIAVPVRNWLDTTFPRHWIGRSGPVRWPARSPDLNPLDFFVWGHLKTIVYRTEIADEADLQQRIFAAAETIRNRPGTLTHVRDNFRRRLEACLRADGSHFQQWL